MKKRKNTKIHALLNEIEACLQDEKIYRSMIFKNSPQWKRSKQHSKKLKKEKILLLNKLES